MKIGKATTYALLKYCKQLQFRGRGSTCLPGKLKLFAQKAEDVDELMLRPELRNP